MNAEQLLEHESEGEPEIEAAVEALMETLAGLPRRELERVGSGLGVGREHNHPLVPLASALQSFGDNPLTRIRLRLFLGMLRDDAAAREALLYRIEGVDEQPWPAVVEAVGVA